MSEVENIELSIEDARKLVARKDAALKLATNREFKQLILNDYYVDEAVRLTSCLGQPQMKNFEAEIVGDLKAIASLRQYFQTIITMGRNAESELVEAQELLEETRAAELEG